MRSLGEAWPEPGRTRRETGENLERNVGETQKKPQRKLRETFRKQPQHERENGSPNGPPHDPRRLPNAQHRLSELAEEERRPLLLRSSATGATQPGPRQRRRSAGMRRKIKLSFRASKVQIWIGEDGPPTGDGGIVPHCLPRRKDGLDAKDLDLARSGGIIDPIRHRTGSPDHGRPSSNPGVSRLQDRLILLTHEPIHS